MDRNGDGLFLVTGRPYGHQHKWGSRSGGGGSDGGGETKGLFRLLLFS